MGANLGDLFDLDKCGAQTVLIDCRLEHAPRYWTGAELKSESNAYARALSGKGFAPGTRIAILAANRAEYLAAYFGIMRAGLVAVPINTRVPASTVRYVIEDSGSRFAFVDSERQALCPDTLETLSFDDDEALTGFLDPGDFPAISQPEDDVAMFLYTSGSTGKPKGVPLTHTGHHWVVRKRFQASIDYAKERLLVAAPLYHMNALAMAKLAAYAGACIVLLPEFTATRYIQAIETFRCTWLTSVPTMLAKVVQERDLLDRTDLSSVTSVRMGSAPVTEHLIEQLTGIFTTARIQVGYGTTEAGPCGFIPHPDGKPTPVLSLGVGDPEVNLRLVDANGQEAEQGVLEIACPALMPGYHNLPEKTAAVMTGDGLYKTGDIMRRDADGFYFFVGRDDDMFVCNGENVYPEQVERLIESHPDIAQACVVPVDDTVRGAMPVAFVVMRDDATIDAEQVKAHTIANGPAYQHPRHVFFETELPLAGTNKLDRNRLQEMAAERVT
ncbi:MAG: class I adenylate-forming enzyme family protein [Pseudomonadota bacterium]